VKLGFNVITFVSDISANSSELLFKKSADNITIYRYFTFNNMKSGGKYYRPIRSAFNAWKLIKSLNKNITFKLNRIHTATLLANSQV
jgi:hypothetical protein